MEETILFALVAILIGFSKGGLGGPVPVTLTVPILTLIMEPQVAIGFILPLLIFADIFALYFYWKQWDRKLMTLMLVPGLIGVALGAFVLKDIDAVTLKRIIGGLTLAALSFKITNERLRRLAYHPSRLAWLVRRLGIWFRLDSCQYRRATLYRLPAFAAKYDAAGIRRYNNPVLCADQSDETAQFSRHRNP